MNLRIRFWSLVATAGLTASMVVNVDYGENHIFSDFQRFYRRSYAQFFGIEDLRAIEDSNNKRR